jgi:hypothetical protein
MARERGSYPAKTPHIRGENHFPFLLRRISADTGHIQRENDFPFFYEPYPKGKWFSLLLWRVVSRYGPYLEGKSFSLRIYAIAKGKMIFPLDIRAYLGI